MAHRCWILHSSATFLLEECSAFSHIVFELRLYSCWSGGHETGGTFVLGRTEKPALGHVSKCTQVKRVCRDTSAFLEGSEYWACMVFWVSAELFHASNLNRKTEQGDVPGLHTWHSHQPLTQDLALLTPAFQMGMICSLPPPLRPIIPQFELMVCHMTLSPYWYVVNGSFKATNQKSTNSIIFNILFSRRVYCKIKTINIFKNNKKSGRICYWKLMVLVWNECFCPPWVRFSTQNVLQ